MGDRKSGNSNVTATVVTVGVAAAAAVGGLLYYLFSKDSNQQENNYSHGSRQNNQRPQSAPSTRCQKSTSKAKAGTGRENIDTCAICCENLFAEDEFASAPVEIPCNHYFHMACIRKWFKQVRSCPICITPIPDDLKTIYF